MEIKCVTEAYGALAKHGIERTPAWSINRPQFPAQTAQTVKSSDGYHCAHSELRVIHSGRMGAKRFKRLDVHLRRHQALITPEP